jgi:predicted ATPase
MLESIKFENFKALRDTTLPLSRFTLMVGANGSGKSTALDAILALSTPARLQFQQARSASVSDSVAVVLTARWKEEKNDYTVTVRWDSKGAQGPDFWPVSGVYLALGPYEKNHVRQQEKPREALHGARVFSLDASVIAAAVGLQPAMELAFNGLGLAGVLDRLRDQSPERFEALNDQIGRWIPEFDRILFYVPNPGARALSLRTREGRHEIKAADLSHGTLIALALLTIAYLPEPPSIVCLEEPDHGLHPRLLRDVRDPFTGWRTRKAPTRRGTPCR